MINGQARASLVTRPANGRAPALPAARARQAAVFSQFTDYSNPESRPLAERCILSFGSNAGPPMLPNYFYNNNYTIVQTRDHLAILTEMEAQGMTESRLDPDAKSGVGARGVMQLMPSTFREIQTKNPEWASVDDVEWNIAAGIYYDRQLWRLWRDGVDDADHHRFMFGSYNAGRVPILTAQRLARERQLDPRGWTAIERVAPEVPRWRHRETVDYGGRIGANLERLDGKGRVVRSSR